MSKNVEKPKIMSDVRPKGASSVFSKIIDPIGRTPGKHRFIPKWIKNSAISLLTLSVFFAFFGGNFFIMAPSAYSQISDEERKNLETELEKIEQEIDGYEKTILNIQEERKTLNQSIKLFDAQINKLNLQIKATDIQLKKLDGEIYSLQNGIKKTEGGIGNTKLLLANYIRQISREDEKSTFESMLANEKFSDMFDDANSLATLQEEIRKNLNQLVEMKTGLIVQKDSASEQRQEVLNLKEIKQAQMAQINQKKKEKNDLIAATKGKEENYQNLLKKSKQTAAQIRSRIFEFLGGGELSFGEAYKFAKFASEQTGVRAALILAVLDRESNFGKNVGKCNYKTAMHPTRDIPVFLEIVKELGISPDSVSVSCANSDGAYGGAMGPAQFIPSTWVKYKDRIAAVTGSKIPSPWRNIDAFTATALYLKDAGAAGGDYYAERKAAAMYYAGSRWKSYLYTYGRVVEIANGFEDDIKAING